MARSFYHGYGHLKRLLSIIFITAVIILSVISYLSLTESGLAFILSHANIFLQGKLTVKSSHGRLIGPIHLNESRYQDNTCDITVSDFDLNWQLSKLIKKQLKVTDLFAAGIKVKIKTAVGPLSNDSKGLPDIKFPIRTILENIRIKNIQISTAESNQPFFINDILIKSDFDNKLIIIDKFEIRSGPAFFIASGRYTLLEKAINEAGSGLKSQSTNTVIGQSSLTGYTGAWDGKWEISIPDLENIFPAGKGQLSGKGTLEGKGKIPSITAKLNGKGLLYGQYQAGMILVDIDLDASDKNLSHIEIKAENIYAEKEYLSIFSLKGNGRIASHSLSIFTAVGKADLLLDLDAGFYSNGWKGIIKHGKVNTAGYGKWKLKKPAKFYFSPENSYLDNLCFEFNEASICLFSKFEKDNGTVYLKGKDFEIMNHPDLMIVVSPDIIIKLKDNNITLDGSILIPRANITPQAPSEAVSLSEDVLIITPSTEKKKEINNWLISGKINLIMGDNVQFNGFGLSCKIKGNLILEENPDNPAKAYGKLQIADGIYKAYGQKLKIDTGHVIFTGPLDDPGVYIKIIRKMRELTTWIEVSGTLKKPVLKIFSVPALDQSDALSYLLFGRPMNKISDAEGNKLYNAALALGLNRGDALAKKIGNTFGIKDLELSKEDNTGQAGLFLGKYLSPRLYIGYGIGIFEPASTFNLRYYITPKWLLQGKYGTGSGGDILYTIEK